MRTLPAPASPVARATYPVMEVVIEALVGFSMLLPPRESRPGDSGTGYSLAELGDDLVEVFFAQ